MPVAQARQRVAFTDAYALPPLCLTHRESASTSAPLHMTSSSRSPDSIDLHFFLNRRRTNARDQEWSRALSDGVSLTMTYFHEGGPHYHRRGLVSRSCSGWEGVGPRRYGRQTVTCCSARGGAEPKWGRSVSCVIELKRVGFRDKVIGSSRTGN